MTANSDRIWKKIRQSESSLLKILLAASFIVILAFVAIIFAGIFAKAVDKNIPQAASSEQSKIIR